MSKTKIKKSNVFGEKAKPAGPKRERTPKVAAKQQASEEDQALACVKMIEDMSEEQQQAAEAYLQSITTLANRLCNEGLVPKKPGQSRQDQVTAAFSHIDNITREVGNYAARQLKNPTVPELAAMFAGVIGNIIAQASMRGAKKPINEEAFNSLEKIFGAAVRLTTVQSMQEIQGGGSRGKLVH